jgi:signal transduction histidine kinase
MRKRCKGIETDIDEVSRLVDSASAQLRSIVVGGPVRTVAPDLHQQLRGLCALFEAETGVKCRVALHQEHLRFEMAVGDTVFRSVRELLSNVRKHAHAKSVRISSTDVSGDDVAISVADNGNGLSPMHWRRAPFEGGGFGLWSIEHRLESLGGRLEIEGGSGVCATILLPRRLLVKS